jgi:3-mercaptopyruvate sulfurtransferase SseA
MSDDNESGSDPEAEWLAEHLDDDDVVLVQIEGWREAYEAEHLPGAVFADGYDDFTAGA